MTTAKSLSKEDRSAKAFREPMVSEEERHSMIAEAAYYRAEQRGFQEGDPVQDWLAAEAEIDEGVEEKG